MTVLVGWALGYRRPPARRWPFLLVFVPVAFIGFGASIGLHNLQVWLETDVIQWMTDRQQETRNPFRSMTAIGEIGELKLHDRILLRVKPIGAFRAGQLLHEASFNRYRNGLWIAGQARFEPLSPAGSRNRGTWNLEKPPSERGFVSEITMKLRDGKGVLSLPLGCYQIRSLPAKKLERNPYGAFRVSAFSPFVSYRARYHPSVRLQAEPNDNDLDLPTSEREVVMAQLKARNWRGGSPKEAVEFVRSFFRSGFTYSLKQEPPRKGLTPLAHFLQVSHSGHCEFFATATVLMLRGAGIPARYATGYAVSEYSRLEKAFVVRSRHAHAWALAYLDGSWVPVDTTPSIWLEAEQEQTGVLTPVVDLFRWAGNRFDIWRHHQRFGGGSRGWLLLLALSGGIVLLWRVLRKRASRKQQTRTVSETVDEATHPVSPFTAVQESLIDAGYTKNRWEPPGEWIARLSRSGLGPDLADDLQFVVRQHYRVCFHPKGLSDDELQQMKIQCRSVQESLAGIQQKTKG
jgi:hypothetical protein